MNEEANPLVGLSPVPMPSSHIMVNKRYIHIPEEYPFGPSAEVNDSWIFSLVPNGLDLYLKQSLVRANKIFSEKVYSYEEIINTLTPIIKNHVPGRDTFTYRRLADAILMHRENFARKILLENNLVDDRTDTWAWKKRDRELSDPKSYPVLSCNKTAQWQIQLIRRIEREVTTYKIFEPILFQVAWNDEVGILRAVEILLDETGYEALEIQAALTR